uniref:GYF domain-containing protein n=1 Tax=Chlamydomonas euryale TaxID=1486919 RepID=A0A6U2DWE8_9CHLO|mmetsp:Transcript_2184/g.5768  ORF Transcript_2184/g.5768 Transcript_2184/m.5768 type:complete len:231 (+) Transcript_2184:93-785(+)
MAEQGGKRPRPADDIDAVIKAELAADMAKRMAKKSSKEPKTKGMTLAQIEDSEGGPIKESMIATAQIKRAALRKKGGKGVADDDADVDMPEDVDQFEEDKAEVEQEGGVKIIPFSLQEERETGHFDEEGNYVEEKENRDDMDAWLDSAEVVDEKLLETIEARKKAEAEAEEAVAKQAPVTERQLAAAKADLASHMLEGETVTRALKRIRGSDNRAAGSRGKSVKDKVRQR